MESMPALPLLVVVVVVLVAAGTDLWNFRLHNALTIPFFVMGVLWHAIGDGASGIAMSGMGTMVAVGPLLIPYALGGMGAGDIKLMAGVGAWLGPWAALHVLIVSGLATGVWTLVLMAWGGSSRWGMQVGKPAESLTHVLSRPDRRAKAVPFGALVALGVIVTAVWLGLAA